MFEKRSLNTIYTIKYYSPYDQGSLQQEAVSVTRDLSLKLVSNEHIFQHLELPTKRGIRQYFLESV